MEYCYDFSNNQDNSELNWGYTGPQLLTKAVIEFNMNSYVVDPEMFCPINWWEWKQLLEGSVDKNRLAASHAVHLWNEMWRRNQMDKSDQFPENCIYEQLKKRYLNRGFLKKVKMAYQLITHKIIKR